MIRNFQTVLFFLCIGLTTLAQKKSITLEDIWVKNTFRQEFVSGFRSMKDGLHYTEINANSTLLKVRFADAQIVDSIVSFKDLKWADAEIKVEDYQFNNDETKMLLFTESEPIYRRSILNKVYVYDLKSKELQQVHAKKILHATFSPQSDKVAYVYDNNLYYLDLNTNREVAVTEDGDYNHLYGNCDWVYEEEFEFTRAFTWSEKGDYIAYYHFDQTEVPEYRFDFYENLYPREYRYKYPKAGEKNSIVNIEIHQIGKRKKIAVDLGENTDIYIPRIKVNPYDNALIVYRLNRLQNHLELLRVDANDGSTEMIYEEKNEAYVEINDHWHFFKQMNAMLFTSEKDGYTHIYYHDLNTHTEKQLTKGNWEITEIHGVDEKNGTVYYTAAESSPLERQLYKVQLDGSQKTCMSPEKGWHAVQFSEGFQYYLDRYSNATQVPIYTLHSQSGSHRILKENKPLQKKLEEYTISPIKFVQVLNKAGTLLNGWVIYPPDFDPSKKYPVFMFQYSGPGSQQVTNQFGGRDFWWYQMLAQKGYIIACFDGTGTGLRGEAFKKKTYLQLGKYESDDQIDVAKYFAAQSYVDPARIGIWGWSYGGYMSSICLLKGADVFKMAIAVAPVTNWRYYDNIYTERYMRTPQVNASGYDDNSPVNMVQQMKGKYLLIHGTADDNVHYQNALEMQKALINAGKEFDSEAYPNKNHGIGGGSTRLHLYRKMTDFILTNL